MDRLDELGDLRAHRGGGQPGRAPRRACAARRPPSRARWRRLRTASACVWSTARRAGWRRPRRAARSTTRRGPGGRLRGRDGGRAATHRCAACSASPRRCSSAAVTSRRSSSRFLDAHEGVEVELLLNDRNIDLIEEGIDVALRIGALADFDAVGAAGGPRAAAVGGEPGLSQRRGTPRAPGDLVRHEAILGDPARQDRVGFAGPGGRCARA